MGTENLDRSAVGHIYVNPGTGEVDLGAIKELTVRVDGKEIDHIDVSSYPFGSDMTVYGTASVEVEFVWEEVADIDLWAMVLHGTAGIATTTAGTSNVTDEVHTLSGEDWSMLTYGDDIDEDGAITVCAETGGASPYTLTTDYFVDRRGGAVVRVDGGNITDGAAVYVNYVKNTFVGKYFEILSDTVPDEYAIRILKPLLNGDNLRIQHTKCTFNTSQEMGLSPGDEGEWAGVTSTIKFKKHDSTYGNFGRWEIYTP